MDNKVVFLGNTGVGKTKWAKSRVGTDVSNYKHIATRGVEVHKIDGCNVWDTAGDPRFIGLADGYYQNADYAVIFFDSTRSGYSLEESRHWASDFLRINPTKSIQYYDVSASSSLGLFWIGLLL